MERSNASGNVAQALWWIGIAAVIAGIGLLVARISLAGNVTLGAGMVLLGLNTLIAGDLAGGTSTRPFAVRGPVVRGDLQASTGLADLAVGTCNPDRIASLQFGPVGKPGFEVMEGVAAVRLKQPAFPPGMTPWRADLAGNVLWDIQARSWLGSLALDLTGLRIEKATVRTTLGRISLTCPTRGYAQATLRAGVGDIEVIVPDQTGAKITIKRGKLASVTVKNKRLISYRPDRYSTQDSDSAPGQIEIVIESWAGDIVLA